MFITITDKVLRELGIIELIFTAQYSKFDETEQFPFILDHTGRSGIDGRYIAALDVFSDVELFNLQLYKKHFTKRFEGSTNHKLLKNQINDIRQKAKKVRNYYNTNLTGKSDIVREYVEKKKELKNKKQFEEGIELFEIHSAVVTISHYHLMELYLGANRSSKLCITDKYTYSYISDNYTLASFCQKLIDFIDSIGISDEQAEKQSWQIEQPKNTIALHFEHEFEKANIPFGTIIKNTSLFKSELINQYSNAETKHCFDLYLADFYSEEELNKGFEEIHRQIPVSNSKEIVAANFVATTSFENRIQELYQQFIDKVIKKELPLKYYCHDIEKTQIVQALRRIDNEHKILQKSVFDEKTDKYKEAEIRANNVIEPTASSENFESEVLEHLKQDNDNIFLFLDKVDKPKIELWDTLKSNFDSLISKAILHKKTTSRKVDPYAITYSTDNYIEFRGQRVYFPFPCLDLANLIARLREIILDETVCSTDLQSYPEVIFDRKEFAGHPDLAGWIYNIIETWITDIEVKIHNNEKSRLFTSFLEICRQKALAWKVEDTRTNTDVDDNINKETGNGNNQNNLTLSKITNKFDKLNIKEVYEYFNKGLVAKKYLTE